MGTGKNDHAFEFGQFRLDPSQHRLLRDGNPVLLTPKAFETLAVLVHADGRVVTKDELMTAVWPDSFVEESGLARNISVIRKALGKTVDGDEFIETLPKVGYRFAAPARRVELDPVSAGRAEILDGVPRSLGTSRIKSRFIVLIALFVLAVLVCGTYLYLSRNLPEAPAAEPRSSQTLAVLPFRPLGGDSSDRTFEIGIADALITRLSSIRQLSMRPTSAVRKYAESSIDPVDAGRELGVEAVIDGAIQKTEDRIMVSVQMLRTVDGAPIWSQRFEQKASDIFSIQDEIAERVVKALRIKIDADEQQHLMRRYTENSQAFAAYVRGRALLSEYTKEGTLGAISAFESAISVDPDYALARDGLATACSEMYLRYASDRDAKQWSDRADAEIAKALAADPDLAETHQALAAVYRKRDFNWEKVLDESKRSLELNPSLEQAHYYRAAAFYHIGLLDYALAETELAERINPQNRTDSLRTRGVIALFDGRYTDAISSFEEVQRLSSRPVSDPHLALAYFYNGDGARAEKLASDLSYEPSLSASTRASASMALFLSARHENAAAKNILGYLEKQEGIDHHAAYSMGAAFAQLGNLERATYWLRRSASTGLACYRLFANDKYLEPLKRQREFIDLVNELQAAENGSRQRYSVAR